MATTVNALTDSKSVLSQSYKDQLNKTCVGGNIAVYRITDSLPAATSRTYSNIIPIKPFSTYGIIISASTFATDGTISGGYSKSLVTVVQLAANAATITSLAPLYSQAIQNGVGVATGLITPSFVFNVSNNSLDVNITNNAPAQNKPCTFSIKIKVSLNRAF